MGQSTDAISATLDCKVTLQLKPLLQAIAKAVIDSTSALLTGNWAPFAKSVVDVGVQFGLKVPDGVDAAHGQAARLVAVALERAVVELIRSHGHHLGYLPQAFGQVAIDADDIRVDLELDRALLETPERAPFVDWLHRPLTAWWVARGLGAAEARSITHRLGEYYAAELAAEWRKNADDYRAVEAFLGSRAAPIEERARDWRGYRALLMRRPHEPVFADTFSLRQVWQPLRAWHADDAPAPSAMLAGPGVRAEPRRRVVRAMDAIGEWLGTADPRDTIRVVSGGPGAGKSSLAKMIAANRAALGEPVLLVELFSFRLADGIEPAINSFGRRQGLRHDVLEHTHAAPLLIILDGLDELSIRGSAGRDAVRALVDEVRDLLHDQNHQGLRVRVLLLGREVVVQGVAHRYKGVGQILHLLPYVFQPEPPGLYRDPGGLAGEDQRDGWWRAYAACKGLSYQGFPPTLAHVAPITTEPLLNYLVAITMDIKGDGFGRLDASQTDVYDALVKKVFDRVHATDGHRPARLSGVEDVTQQAFVEFLRAVAVTAWHGEGRVVTLSAIRGRCPEAVLRQMQALERGAESAISRLIAAFYFREHGDARLGDKAFEFTHQSFAEYLVAGEIVAFLQVLPDEAARYQLDCRRGSSPEQQLAEWARLFGPEAIEPNTFDFVLDGLGRSPKGEVEAIADVLADLLRRVLIHDFPLVALGTEGYADGVLARSRNAGEALLALASACGEVLGRRVPVEAVDRFVFGAWLRRLQRPVADMRACLVLRRLSWLQLGAVVLHRADLWGADLHGTGLPGARLGHVSLHDAELSGADLSRAQLTNAWLRGARLIRANARGAGFVGAILQNVFALMADFQGASFERADLEGCNFEGSNLRNVVFVGAHLHRAGLKRVDARQARFQRAFLRNAYLPAADLRDASFDGADLTDADMKAADLRNADLTGADLTGTQLQGADLRTTTVRLATLAKALFDDTTRWPDGFDPEAQGAERVASNPHSTRTDMIE